MHFTTPVLEEETKITNAWMTAMLPFSFMTKKEIALSEELLGNGYSFFNLNDKKQQSEFYGDIELSSIALKQNFLSYIERRLFPKNIRDDGFQRFSKQISKTGSLQIHDRHYLFTILSIDITLCPFGIGFVSIRVKLDDVNLFSDALDFMHHFRILEPKTNNQLGMEVQYDGEPFTCIHDFIMKHLCPEIQKYTVHDDRRDGYFGSLPYFEDERMLVTNYIELDEDHLPIEQLYRASQLDGYTEESVPFISAANTEHMEEYLKTRVNTRYMPKLCDITTEHVQTTIVYRDTTEAFREKARVRFMGVHYYTILLHYFYKLTLLELSFRYCELAWKKDEIYVEKLMQLITMFSSKYYFQEVSSRSSSREMSKRLREIFKIDELFSEVSKTLDALYVNQQKAADKRQNYLLFVLTMFTVVSGIYGMNLIIEEWDGNYKWSEIFHYNIYEWICLITAVGGILMTFFLLVSTFYNYIRKRLQFWLKY